MLPAGCWAAVLLFPAGLERPQMGSPHRPVRWQVNLSSSRSRSPGLTKAAAVGINWPTCVTSSSSAVWSGLEAVCLRGDSALLVQLVRGFWSCPEWVLSAQGRPPLAGTSRLAGSDRSLPHRELLHCCFFYLSHIPLLVYVLGNF